MKKRYLKTIEDIEALRGTDTKIYKDGSTGYHKFVNGVLCFFNTDSAYIFYNVTMDFNQKGSNLYIEVEDELSFEDDIGKLGWFYDEYMIKEKFIDSLASIDKEAAFKYRAKADRLHYQFFQPLTPEEVEKYTGYKVVKEEQ